MGIFNTEENIGKIKFGEMFNRIRVIEGYKGLYSVIGLIFAEPNIPESSDGVYPDIPELVEIPWQRSNSPSRQEDLIRYIIDNIESIDDIQIDSNSNIPRQLIGFFDNYSSGEVDVDSMFIRFDNRINRTFISVAEQHDIRRRFDTPGFGPVSHCAYIHFIIHTKLKTSYKETGLDCVHWFLPVELKEGWG